MRWCEGAAARGKTSYTWRAIGHAGGVDALIRKGAAGVPVRSAPDYVLAAILRDIVESSDTMKETTTGDGDVFQVSIKTINAAFDGEPGHEVARMLREIADKVDEGFRNDGYVRDYNGNTVGRWSLDDI